MGYRDHAVDLIARNEIDIIVNTPNDKKGAQDDSIIRKAAIRGRLFYVTTMAAARATMASGSSGSATVPGSRPSA